MGEIDAAVIGGATVGTDILSKDKTLQAKVKKAKGLLVRRDNKWEQQHCYKTDAPYPHCTMECESVDYITVPSDKKEKFELKYKDGFPQNLDSLFDDPDFKTATLYKKNDKDKVDKKSTTFIRLCTGAILYIDKFEK